MTEGLNASLIHEARHAASYVLSHTVALAHTLLGMQLPVALCCSAHFRAFGSAFHQGCLQVCDNGITTSLGQRAGDREVEVG